MSENANTKTLLTNVFNDTLQEYAHDVNISFHEDINQDRHNLLKRHNDVNMKDIKLEHMLVEINMCFPNVNRPQLLKSKTFKFPFNVEEWKAELLKCCADMTERMKFKNAA